MNSLKGQIEARTKEFERSWNSATATQTSTLGIDVSLKGISFEGVPEQWKQQIINQMQQNLSSEVPTIKDMLNQAMESSVWQWTRDVRNIVDTGALRSSLSIRMNGFGLVVSYSKPYAALVHYGGVMKTGMIYPARPWAEAVLIGGGPVSQINWTNILEGK